MSQINPSRMSASEYLKLSMKDLGGRASSSHKSIKPEEALHRDCFKLLVALQAKYPTLRFMFHCPNGGGRGAAEAGMLKATGVRPGVPDFTLPFSCGKWSGAMIELKAGKNKLTVEQRGWLQFAESQGYLVGVARSLSEFEVLIKSLFDSPDVSSMPGYVEIWAK